MDEYGKESLNFLPDNKNSVNENYSKKAVIYYSYANRSSSELSIASSHEYSKFTELNDFLLELTKHVLRSASKESKETPPNSIKEIIYEYTTNCLNGDYILLKSFQSIQSTHLNRICFIFHFSKLFNLESEGVNFNGNDYFQLLRLICGDFQYEILFKAIKYILKEKNENEKQILNVLIPGKVFLKGLFLVTVYKEFCEETERILISSNNSIEKYAINILRVYHNLKERWLLEECYGPPLGMIYSILLIYAKDLEEIENNKKIIVFSKVMLGIMRCKGTINAEILLNEIIYDSIFEKIVNEKMTMFSQENQNLKIENIENILNEISDEEEVLEDDDEDTI